MNERVYNSWDSFNADLELCDVTRNNIASFIYYDILNKETMVSAIKARIDFISQDEGELHPNWYYPHFISRLKEFIKYLEETEEQYYLELKDLLLNKYLTQYCDAVGFSCSDNNIK